MVPVNFQENTIGLLIDKPLHNLESVSAAARICVKFQRKTLSGSCSMVAMVTTSQRPTGPGLLIHFLLLTLLRVNSNPFCTSLQVFLAPSKRAAVVFIKQSFLLDSSKNDEPIKNRQKHFCC